MTPDEFKVKHLVQRIAAVTADYEEKIANLQVEHVLALQEKDDEIERLKNPTDDEKDTPTP